MMKDFIYNFTPVLVIFSLGYIRMNLNLELTNIMTNGSYGKIYGTNDDTIIFKSFGKCIRDYDDNFICPSILRELSIINYLKSNDIIKLNKVIFQKNNINLGFFMKKYDLTLFNLIPEIKDHQIKYIIFSLLKSLLYCHTNYITHRDLKPANILLEFNKEKDNYDVILIDFGLSKFDFFYDDYTNFFSIPIELTNENIQTLWYRAPEVILNKTHNYKMDIWSIGIIFLDMIKRKNGCISAKTSNKQLLEYVKNLGNEDANLNLIRHQYGIINSNFSIFDELGNFEKEGIDLLKKMLSFDPDERISCLDALKHNYFNDIRGGEINPENFFLFNCNFNKIRIDVVNFPKIYYNRKKIIDSLNIAQVNCIIIEWIIYLIDYYIVHNNTNFPYSCISTEEFAIFLTYLYYKFMYGDTFEFYDVSKMMFDISFDKMKISALNEIEFDLFTKLDHTLIIKTPGLILYKFFTMLYEKNMFNIETLDNILKKLSYYIQIYLLERTYYIFDTDELISTMGKKILKEMDIIIDESYLNFIKCKYEDNLSYLYFLNKLD